MIYILQAKRGVNGGCVFIKWNEETHRYATGNTASTAYSTSNGLLIYGVTNKEVRDIEQQLQLRGFVEHTPVWNNKDTDAYEDIAKAGL